jgi:hypothetical protein
VDDVSHRPHPIGRSDKALTCAPMIAPRDSNENQRLWMMLDHALKDAHIGLLVQLSCGVSSAEVKESMLMDNFARNHDTLAVLMHRRTELCMLCSGSFYAATSLWLTRFQPLCK